MAYDVIVLGLGAMGSAAAQHLAERGKRVLGIEQFTSPHDKGSSHGGSRMIRQAYFESPDYIPLVLRAYELWRKLERDTGKRLLHITGGLNIGSGDGELVKRTIAASTEHSIPFEVLEGRAISTRFPECFRWWAMLRCTSRTPDTCFRKSASGRNLHWHRMREQNLVRGDCSGVVGEGRWR